MAYSSEDTIPYNPMTQQCISDKSVADAVEALIGAHLVSLGPRAALLLMKWLDLSVFVDPEPPVNPLLHFEDTEEDVSSLLVLLTFCLAHLRETSSIPALCPEQIWESGRDDWIHLCQQGFLGSSIHPRLLHQWSCYWMLSTSGIPRRCCFGLHDHTVSLWTSGQVCSRRFDWSQVSSS